MTIVSRVGILLLWLLIKENLFGEIIDAEVQLSDFGKIVEKTWLELPDHNPNINPDNSTIMPNHFHGIIQLKEDSVRAGSEPPQLYAVYRN